MGDTKSGPVRLPFDPQLRVGFRGATVASDAGLLLSRELDDRLVADLFRQSIYSRLAGGGDTNDAEGMARDPVPM